LELQKRPIRNPLIVLREEFDDWAVLFNPDSANAIGINPVGVSVWKAIDGQRGINEIVLEIQKEFSDVPHTAAGDISAFMGELYRSGFVGYDLESMDQ
jgi:SynChlorMet cassette protein ScmD